VAKGRLGETPKTPCEAERKSMVIRFDFKRPDRAEFQKLLMQEVGGEIKKVIPLAVDKMKKPIQNLIRREFETSSTTYRLMLREDSELRGSLGVEEMSRAAEAIVSFIVSSVNVVMTNRVKVSDKEVSVGVRVTILGGTGSLTDIILNEPSIRNLIQYTSTKGHHVPWLEWLLTAGDGVVVADYYVDFGPYKSPEPSRTGLAIMIKSPGSRYRVPTAHSGTPRDNFITRILDKPSLLDGIGDIVENTLKKFLKDL